MHPGFHGLRCAAVEFCGGVTLSNISCGMWHFFLAATHMVSLVHGKPDSLIEDAHDVFEQVSSYACSQFHGTLYLAAVAARPPSLLHAFEVL